MAGENLDCYDTRMDAVPCERCQGNGEIVTDWERYLHPHDGDPPDVGTEDCPDCDGTGGRRALEDSSHV